MLMLWHFVILIVSDNLFDLGGEKTMIGRKKTGQERRELILNWLMESKEPLTGQIIAEKTNVSRQVIVQDISLLKAKNEPIIATAQGYIYLNDEHAAYPSRRIIACRHSPKETAAELFIMVDNGVAVKNVIVEHPIYGELTASLMIKNRRDVLAFIKKMEITNASYLSDLTEGVHLHTIEAETEEQLDELCIKLEESGFLLNKLDS